MCKYPLQGDSGGPLACINMSGDWVIAGTLTGGSGDCSPDLASIFTRTSFFRDWIDGWE